MRDDYTPAVSRALALAQHIAEAQGVAEVEPTHLLRSLLAEEEGRPFLLVCAVGAAPERLHEWLTPLPQITADRRPELPLARSTQDALHRARDLARDVALDPTVSSEQVMLTLLWEDSSLRQSVESLGVDVGELEKQIFASIQGPAIALDEPLHLDDVCEPMDTARILDAGANRTREALRVLEDYARFALDDALITAELKALRHELAETLEPLAAQRLLTARDTVGDVGRDSRLPPQQRYSLREVAHVNLKRLQEALRSLEEYTKLADPALGQRLELMRYRSYTLERMLLLGATARERLADVRLCMLISGSQCYGPLEWTVREACAGGVQMIQLREKALSDRELLARAQLIRAWTRETGALFIVNDRPDIARLVEADGVHLGQDDLPVKEARRIVGADALIGVSTHDAEQVRRAVRAGASYLGVGPTFTSATKDFSELAGLEFVRQAAAETTLPSFIIGGVTLANLPPVLAAGGRRIAVSSALCRSDAPQALATALRQKLDAN